MVEGQAKLRSRFTEHAAKGDDSAGIVVPVMLGAQGRR